MIDYLPNESIYFTTNYEYCEMISKELKNLKIPFEGSCTSYGYDIYATFFSNGIQYQLNYHKHQSTGTPVGLKVDTRTRQYVNLKALNINSGSYIQINGFTFLNPILWNKHKLNLDKEHLLYTSKKLDTNQILITKNAIDKLDIIRLKQNKHELSSSFWNDQLLPSDIVSTFDRLIENWA